MKGERSVSRDILTLKQHVSSSLFRPCQVVSHGCQPVPIELSIASFPKDGKGPEAICLTVDHSNLRMTPKDSRSNHYIKERLSLKKLLPGSVPLEYPSLYFRGKFCHLAQGNRGLIIVKGLDQRKFFKNWDILQSTWKRCPISGILMTAPCLTTCTMRCTSILIYPSAPW
ncbi:hypothetical protein TNCV_1905251 [Trichonephila clavipes]|nr:hypothetical protein TNCV_1905251 [Trichonephila clavipes]